MSLFCGVVHGVLSSLENILLRKRELVALLCVVAVCVLCLFLRVLWVGLWSVIAALPGHTHFFMNLAYSLYILSYCMIMI